MAGSFKLELHLTHLLGLLKSTFLTPSLELLICSKGLHVCISNAGGGAKPQSRVDTNKQYHRIL